MKKIISLLLCVIFMLICAFNVNATSHTASWYCVRKKDHTQPNLPSDLAFSKEYDLYWIDERYSSYNDEEKVIYLTFDAGYENGNVERILDALRDEGVFATFFILSIGEGCLMPYRKYKIRYEKSNIHHIRYTAFHKLCTRI